MKDSAVRIVATVACAVASAFVCTCLPAQQSSAPPQKSGENAAVHECTPKRSILPDGTLVILNRDCTTTQVSKTKVQDAVRKDKMPAADQPVTDQPGARQPVANSSDPSAQAAKLRDMKPQALPPGEDDPKLRAKYLEAMNGYFDYYTAGYLHRQQVFEWQLLSSKIIFVLVTLLVCSGVYFAALQFHEGMRRRAAEMIRTVQQTGAVQEERPMAHAEDSTVTTFSASAKGISVSSPVLGVIILVISLAFFYLYLVYVYPITELF